MYVDVVGVIIESNDGCDSRVLDLFFFFQAEDGIRDLVRSRGLGDVYKRQAGYPMNIEVLSLFPECFKGFIESSMVARAINLGICLLYTSDAADDLLCVDLGGRRIIKKKKNK